MPHIDNSFFQLEDGTPLPPVNNDTIEEKSAINRLKRMKDDFDTKWEHMGPLERERREKDLKEQRRKVAAFKGTGMLEG